MLCPIPEHFLSYFIGSCLTLFRVDACCSLVAVSTLVIRLRCLFQMLVSLFPIGVVMVMGLDIVYVSFNSSASTSLGGFRGLTARTRQLWRSSTSKERSRCRSGRMAGASSPEARQLLDRLRIKRLPCVPHGGPRTSPASSACRKQASDQAEAPSTKPSSSPQPRSVPMSCG
jgi:hypothetical protein